MVIRENKKNRNKYHTTYSKKKKERKRWDGRKRNCSIPEGQNVEKKKKKRNKNTSKEEKSANNNFRSWSFCIDVLN